MSTTLLVMLLVIAAFTNGVIVGQLDNPWWTYLITAGIGLVISF